MEKAEFDSIYNIFAQSKDRLVVVTYNDDSMELGMLVGFFCKEEEEHHSYIYGWHFIKDEYLEYYLFNAADFGIGKIIEAKDIKMIKFRSS